MVLHKLHRQIAESDPQVSSLFQKLMDRRFALASGFFLFAMCVVLGSIPAVMHVKNRNLSHALVNTTCLLLKYKEIEHLCAIGGSYGLAGDASRCFDEHFDFLYSIANQSRITSALSLRDQGHHHHQIEVGGISLCSHRK